MSRRALILLSIAGLFSLCASLLWRLPMRVLADALLASSPPALRDGLRIPQADGLWHDGGLALNCVGVDKQTHDCGRYRVTLRSDGLRALQLDARQTGGGSLHLMQPVDGGAASGTLRQFRLPINALALGLPILSQLQLSGPILLNGEFTLPQRARVDGVWTGRIGDSALPPQAVSLSLSNGALDLRLSGSPDWPKVEGQVLCEGQQHCRGEVFIITRQEGSADGEPAQAVDPRLQTLLGAVAREVAPGRFRVLIDGKGR